MTAQAVARALVAALVLTIAGVGAGLLLVLGVLLAADAVGVMMTPLRTIAVSLVFATGLGFGGVALAYLRRRGLPISYVGISRPSRADALAVGAGYVTALVLVAIAGVETLGNTLPRPRFDRAAERPRLGEHRSPLVDAPGNRVVGRAVDGPADHLRVVDAPKSYVVPAGDFERHRAVAEDRAECIL